MFIIINREIEPLNKEKMIEFNNKISKYTSNYILLVINQSQHKERSHTFTYVNNIHFLELHTFSIDDGVFGVLFIDDQDNIYLDNILNTNYKFNIKNDIK